MNNALKDLIEQAWNNRELLKDNAMQKAIRDVVDILGSRWKVEILTGVARGHCRFSELKTFLYEISEKMLASGLRELTDLQLIERTDRFGYTNRAEYRITRQGLRLFSVIFAMQEWGEGYRKEVFGIVNRSPNGE